MPTLKTTGNVFRAMRALQEKLQGHERTLPRFLLVGLSNTAVSFVAYVFIYGLWKIAFVAQALAYLVGILWSFSLNSRWTFAQSTFRARQFLRFIVVQVSLLVTSSVAISLAVDVSGHDPNVSWLVVMVIVTLVNYVATSRWVFQGVDR